MWPPPPADARLAFETFAYEPSELGAKTGFFRKIANFFTGKNVHGTPFKKPFGLFADNWGNLCITDLGHAAFGYFNKSRKRFQWHQEVSGIKLAAPIAVLKQAELIYIADSGLNKVLACTTEAELLFEIEDEHLQRPAGLAAIGDHLYVSDSKLHQVHVYTLYGKYVKSIGSQGALPGQFNYPTLLASDHDNRLYINDTLNHRVQVLDRDGTFIREWGRLGQGSGTFNRSKGMAFDGQNNIYVADALFDNVQIFDAAGQFLLHVGENGEGPGQFWQPGGVAIDGKGYLYIADAFNQRIQQFKLINTTPDEEI